MPKEYFYQDSESLFGAFVPNCIDRNLTHKFGNDGMLAPSVQAAIDDLHSKGWRFFVVDQSRGRAYFQHKVIVIPNWAVERQRNGMTGYLDWYVAHECAHGYIREAKLYVADHGPEFMAELIRICPNAALKYELGYKPRNAATAGITENGYVKPLPKKLSLDDL